MLGDLLPRLAEQRLVRGAAARVFGALSFLEGRRVRIEGVDFVAPSADRYLALWLDRFGLQESFTLEVFSSLLRPGMVVVDVGANVGRFTVRAARTVGPGGQVHAVEPEPRNAAALRQTVRLSGLGNVQVHELAATDTDGALSLYVCEEHRGDHSLLPRPLAHEVRVPAARLDTLLAGGQVDLVKIDVQGVEHLVLRGMTALLQARPTLVVELWPRGLRQSGAAASEPLEQLAAAGYRFDVIDERTRSLQATTVEAAVARCGAYGYVNILARPETSDSRI